MRLLKEFAEAKAPPLIEYVKGDLPPVILVAMLPVLPPKQATLVVEPVKTMSSATVNCWRV